MGETPTDEDLLLKSFFAEVSEVERDNEVIRYLSLYMYVYIYIYLNDAIRYQLLILIYG